MTILITKSKSTKILQVAEAFFNTCFIPDLADMISETNRVLTVVAEAYLV